MSDFRKELERLLNSHGRESVSDTPDFVLADFLWSCLFAFDTAVNDRSRFYGHHDRPEGNPAWPKPPSPYDLEAIRKYMGEPAR